MTKHYNGTVATCSQCGGKIVFGESTWSHVGGDDDIMPPHYPLPISVEYKWHKEKPTVSGYYYLLEKDEYHKYQCKLVFVGFHGNDADVLTFGDDYVYQLNDLQNELWCVCEVSSHPNYPK